ncbi:DUF4189 domain-containing protein [Streptomyces albidoflavus]|uniref:DUF4189 domain-containing protein n=1 Tax=Streptomyces albidoflavus TaxID=1886 RepID=UPI0033A8DF9D
MTAGGVSVVDHSTLALGRRLGQGGQGTVYQVTNKRVMPTQGGGWDAVYKEYAPAVLSQLDVPALETLVGLPGRSGATQGRWLCERTAWPAAVVRRHGVTCGFLMRAVPERFMFDQRGLGSTVVGRRLANVEYLLNDDAYVAGIGLVVSDRDRFRLLTDLAETLARLHAMGVTIGDLSPKNLLFTTTPRPACFFIDCDAVRLRGTTALPQAETPDWEIPAGEPKATPASDAYKLALLAVRLLGRHQTSTDPAALASYSPELGRLARAGLGHDPAARPEPAQWTGPLNAASRKASTRPATGNARPGQPPTGAPPGSGPASTPPVRRQNQGVGIAVAVALGLTALLVLEAQDDDTSSAPSASTSVSPAVSPTTAWPAPVPTRTRPDPPPPPPRPTPTRTRTTPPPPPKPVPPPPKPPPPKPPPSYYGAIAVNTDGVAKRAWDHRTGAAARAAALKSCNRSDCKVLVTFVNGCGAVAYNPSTRRYHGGSGDSSGAATRDAIARAGGGQWVTWVCTTR